MRILLCIGLLLSASSSDAFVVPRGNTWKHPIMPTSFKATTSKLQMSSSSSYEKLMEKLPSEKVVQAVAGSNSKVVASDVAAKAGVSLAQAQKDLTALASLSRGDISVSKDGDLIYEFPPNLNGVLSQNSQKYKALQLFQKVWPTVFWGVRISFGVALLASVVLIFSTLLFINSSSSRDDDRRDNRGGGGLFGGPSFYWGPSPFDIFYFRPYGGYGYYGADAGDPSEMGFLESVFSYIFGDGDPNQNLEEKRLQLAAQMIRQNNGAVTAEQLAPYCDVSTEDGSSNYVDESFVLPIATQLDGQPKVTEDGDIIYVFEDLQVSASSSASAMKPQLSNNAIILKRAGLPSSASSREIQNLLYVNGISAQGALEKKDLIKILDQALPPMTPAEEEEFLQDDPNLLLEREYKFSLAPDLNKFLAGGLGVVNLGGALYLGSIFRDYAAYGVQLPSFLGLTQSIYPLLLGYAILFNVIPLARNFWIQSKNGKIQERNQARRKWLTKLESGSGSVGRKLKAAAKFALGRKTLKSDDVVFDTKTTSTSDLTSKRNKNDLDEFDKLLDDEKNAFQ